MTMEEIEARFNALEGKVDEVVAEIEEDNAHMAFINSLKQYVN